MLAAPIFEVGGLAHRCDGLPSAALDERDPGFAGQLLYGHLARPILIACLAQLVLEHAQAIDSVLRLRQLSIAGSTDRAAEPRYRLGLCERCFRDGKRRRLGPRSALEGIADRNGCKGGVSAVAESCRIFGNAVASINNTLCLLVLPQLQIGIREEIERVIARRVLGGIPGGLWIDACGVGHR